MRWYGISGSWRRTSEDVANDVRQTVENIVLSGDGIITGGALGVDYIATDAVLHSGKPENQLRIYLPTRFDVFKDHFFRRAREGVITLESAKMLINQLNSVKNASIDCIIEGEFNKVNEISYYARNSKIIQNCDELYAFQVNDSKGVQDAIDKARKLGKPVHIRKYTID